MIDSHEPKQPEILIMKGDEMTLAHKCAAVSGCVKLDSFMRKDPVYLHECWSPMHLWPWISSPAFSTTAVSHRVCLLM